MTTREPYRAQRIGNLRERVTIQRYTTVDDGYGNQIRTWADLATVFARVEPLKGEERAIAGGMGNPYSVTIHIRHRDVSPGMNRIMFKGKEHRIQYVRNLDERGRFLALDCEVDA